MCPYVLILQEDGVTFKKAKITRSSVYNIKRTSNHISNIMSGILLSPSPVTSFCYMRKSGARYLRGISGNDYTTSARKLEAANMGQVLMSSYKGGAYFIKKAPDLVKDILEERFSSLCTYEEYCERYHLPVPRIVNKSTLQKQIKFTLSKLK